MQGKSEDLAKVVEEFDIARAHWTGPYDSTVGYGEKYPEYAGNDFAVKMNNSATGIYHPSQSYEHGFDLTHFGTSTHGIRQFIKLLDKVGLDPITDFTRVYRDLGRNCDNNYPDYWLYVWSNSEVMVATTCNPINGDGASSTVASEQGYAGYIGIGGTKTAVKTAAEAVKDLAETVKDEQAGGLFF